MSVNLKTRNTLGVSAVADQVVTVTDGDSLIDLVEQRQLRDLLVLGEGSNVVLASRICRPVALMRNRGITVQDHGDHVDVTAAAGENWHELVMWTLAEGYFGLENLALIPGSIGAAPMQNIGAYGVELADFFLALTAVNLQTGERCEFSRTDCRFGYRDSVFKSERGRFAIIDVTVRLRKTPDVVDDYPDLRNELRRSGITQPSPQQLAAAVIRVREAKLPDPHSHPNAGSFFKNPLVTGMQVAALRRTLPELRSYPTDVDDLEKLSAAQLIDVAGWKEKPGDGRVRVWPKQPLVLINDACESGEEILRFAARIQDNIAARFGVQLEIEPDTIGFNDSASGDEPLT
jgi:UDP-N-acetylmuramate dehydrogenase